MADNTSEGSSDGDATSLAHQINVAIASSHTTINRLILDRMPKAVPPQTDNPSTYITGLLHMGAVYVAFESLWQNLLGIHSEIAPIPYSFPFNHDPDQRDGTPQIRKRLRRVLEEAYWPNLLRAARIKADVQTMTGWPDHIYDEQLRSAGTSGKLGKFTLHIRDSINAKPHLLLAYAYCLYLALLSGGSYIRTELMYLEEDFWRTLPTPIKPNMVACRLDKVKPRRRQSSLEDDTHPSQVSNYNSSAKLPLEFLDFDPPLGKNPRQQTKGLKAEFKHRFAEAEQLLVAPERKDIVQESSLIFHHVEGVVTQLDALFGSGTHIPHQLKSHAQRAFHPHSRTGGIGFRLRDSIAIAKGRLMRTRQKSSGSSVTATVPTPAEALSGTSSDKSDSSEPSSASGGKSDEEEDQEEYDEDAQPKTKQPKASLAHDVVVPADGFRTIRYGSDDSRPKASSTSPLRLNDDKNKEQNLVVPRSFDGASSELGYCPFSRGPLTATAAVQTKAEPNYALYAIISNFVVLVGVFGFFLAYLHVRHLEGATGIVGL